MAAEIPASLFFTGLLTYWIMGLVYVRARRKVLVSQKRRHVSLQDITGFLSLKRTCILLSLLVCFVVLQTLLHFAYLTTETNRAVFSSYRHFRTSEDVREQPGTAALIVLNALFGLAYLVAFFVELTRSCLDFNRLSFSVKASKSVSLALACFTLANIMTKPSRAGGFDSLLLLTVIYNVYMWHLGYLYAPCYKSEPASAEKDQPVKDPTLQEQQ